MDNDNKNNKSNEPAEVASAPPKKSVLRKAAEPATAKTQEPATAKAAEPATAKPAAEKSEAAEPATAKAAEPATAKPAAEKSKAAEPATAACPHCDGDHTSMKDKRFKLRIEVDILVDSKKEAREISRMYETLGGVLQATGSPVRMRSDVYGKHGDDGHEPEDDVKDDDTQPQPAFNLNMN